MWARVPGFGDKYFISDSGVLVSTASRSRVKSPKDLSNTNHTIRPAIKKDGYYGVRLKGRGNSKNVYIHRLVAIAFIPNPDHKQQVNHKNGDKLDNRVENLEWVTARENTIHAWEHGLHGHICRGLRRLSDDEVVEIRRSQETQRELARRYGVCQSTISSIKNRKRYKEVI